MFLPGVYDSINKRLSNFQDIWIVSDTHFADPEAHQKNKTRPSDENFVKAINARCGRRSVLIHLGDVGALEYVRQLKAGYKILIMGNHDETKSKFLDYFDEVYEGPWMIGEKYILSHEPIPSLSWAMNIHGHNHCGSQQTDPYHFNCNCDVVGYEPIHLISLLKNGLAAKVCPLHRQIVNKAANRPKTA